MPRSVDNILAHADELAERFENYEPQPGDERDPAIITERRDAAIQRSVAEHQVRTTAQHARADGLPWADAWRFESHAM